MVNKMTLGLVTGVCGFLAYCIYFDSKRRKDPAFKQKLRERRAASKKLKEERESTIFPDMNDHEAVQKFFIKELQLGEELLAYGDFDNGIQHLSNAVTICGQPKQLLSLLQKSLTPQLFALLLSRLPSYGNKEKAIIEEEVE